MNTAVVTPSKDRNAAFMLLNTIYARTPDVFLLKDVCLRIRLPPIYIVNCAPFMSGLKYVWASLNGAISWLSDVLVHDILMNSDIL